MYCEKCERELEPGAAYCATCGAACATYPDNFAELDNLGPVSVYASPDMMRQRSFSNKLRNRVARIFRGMENY